MGPRSVLAYHSPCNRPAPALLEAFAEERALEVRALARPDDVLALVNRTYPAAVVLGTAAGHDVAELCRALKRDAFSAIIPVVVWAAGESCDVVHAGLEAGADEVLTPAMGERERRLRLQMALRRADRDVSVHPTTRLPGTAQIERDIAERLKSGEKFAVCYADLDHFKEFNDRYGYTEGDRVILLLSRILRDVVKAHAPTGFVGHIGGDDFIFNVPLASMRVCCEEIVSIFDELIPQQYTEEDRRVGYFLGSDRRGNILWVPLMTLSIGVVTNRARRFTHTARVSELATEMKSYAKKLPGSVYAVDRRSDGQPLTFDLAQPPETHPAEAPLEP